MEPTGQRPAAVYITVGESKTHRLLPITSRDSKAPGDRGALENIDLETGIVITRSNHRKYSTRKKSTLLQNGGLVPFASRPSEPSNLPSSIDNSYLFVGVLHGVQLPLVGKIWIVNNSGENQFITDIKLGDKASLSKAIRIPRLSSIVRPVYAKLSAPINRLAVHCARRLVKTFAKTTSQYFCIHNPERLGHLVANTDVFLSERKLGLHSPRTDTVFYVKENQQIQDFGSIQLANRISNKAFYQLLGKSHKIMRLSPFMERVMEYHWHNENSIVNQRLHIHRDIHNALDKTPPNIKLPSEYLEKGEHLLDKAGISKPFKIALVHMRDEHYTKSKYEGLADVETLRYGYRNVSASNYEKAVLYLHSKGYRVIQMGAEVIKAVQPSSNVLKARQICNEDWFDLYVSHVCDLFLGNTSGAYALADLYRKPIIFTNFAPLGHVYSWSSRHMTIFKKLLDKYNNAFVPASHQLNSTVGWTIHMDKIDPDRFAYIENTSDEIWSVTREMVERLEGKWNDSESDSALQKKFWNQLPRGYLHNEMNSRIGSDFLRSNTWLLE